MYPSFSKKEPVHSMLEDILQLSGSVHLFAQAIGVPQFLDGQQRYPTLTAAGTQRYWTGSLDSVPSDEVRKLGVLFLML